MITEKSINFHVKLNFNNKRWNIGNMEWGYVFDLVNITGWTPLVLAGPPPCPGQGSGVPHYPGGVSDAGGNPSLTCLWNSLRPSCHPPTTERQWTLNKPVLLYKWLFKFSEHVPNLFVITISAMIMFKLNFTKITTDIGKIIWKILLGESIINFNKPALPYQKYGRIGQKLLHKRFFHNRAFPTL